MWKRRRPFPPDRTSVFFGTSDFAVPALRVLANATRCTLVVTQPDRPAKRGQKLQPTPVKVAAAALGVPSIEPERLRDAYDVLVAVAADLFVVASYGKIVPQRVLDLPPLGALNVHPSLLPLYRGATPLQSQLRDGVRESGVTIIAMDAGMDTGDIVLQLRDAIGPHETYGTLHDRYALLGADALGRAIAQLTSGDATRTPQAGLADEALVAATLTRPLAPHDLQIDPRRSARAIADLVRSLAPQPLARLRIGTEDLKIAQASFVEGAEAAQLAASATLLGFAAPGDAGGEAAAVLTIRAALPHAVTLARPDGMLVIERVVPPSRGVMPAAAWLRGRVARDAAPAPQ